MMSSSPSAAPRPALRKAQNVVTLVAFLLAIQAALGFLAAIEIGPLNDPLAQRYVSHPVEKVEVLLFFVALGALFAKVGGFLLEWRACRRTFMPAWDGRPISVSEAGGLRAGLQKLSRRLQGTYLVQRCAAVLDFVHSRHSANELDDQLRALADNDAVAVENSHSLIRFITWAIPILGFLGTVLGITEAIAGVTPDMLEKSLSPVTDGLALAFDTTALALALTMIIMFVNFLVDRLEQNMLQSVDRYVEEQLAHRFERHSAESSAFVETVRRQTEVLVSATEKLVQRQADIWAIALQKAECHWQEAAQKQQTDLRAALEASLTRTLDDHDQRLLAMEAQSAEHGKALVQQLADLAQTLREVGREQQLSMAALTQQLTAQTGVLTRVQKEGQQLVRLEEVLRQNLATVVGIGKFDEALHSLTAAIHLLTARAASRTGAAA